jgi:hypothetical protein
MPAMPDPLQGLKVGNFLETFQSNKGHDTYSPSIGINKCIWKLENFRYRDEHVYIECGKSSLLSFLAHSYPYRLLIHGD